MLCNEKVPSPLSHVQLLAMPPATFWLVLTSLVGLACSYDPEDKLLDTVLPQGSQFEPFYPRKAYGLENGDSRPAHGHGTFYQHRHPALVDAANAPAYGFRFDGKRRFNFD